MQAELDQVDGRPIIGPELHLECPIGASERGMKSSARERNERLGRGSGADRVLEVAYNGGPHGSLGNLTQIE